MALLIAKENPSNESESERTPCLWFLDAEPRKMPHKTIDVRYVEQFCSVVVVVVVSLRTIHNMNAITEIPNDWLLCYFTFGYIFFSCFFVGLFGYRKKTAIEMANRYGVKRHLTPLEFKPIHLHFGIKMQTFIHWHYLVGSMHYFVFMALDQIGGPGFYFSSQSVWMQNTNHFGNSIE